MPNARVVYVSATGASELSHMAYMDRLGLWGRGTAFDNAQVFQNEIGARGVGAMEMVWIWEKMSTKHTLAQQSCHARIHQHEFLPER